MFPHKTVKSITRPAAALALVLALLCSAGSGAFFKSASAATSVTISGYQLPDGATGNVKGSVVNMYIVIQSNGVTVKTGFTPLTFAGNAGQTYTAIASDYNNIVFDHWGNGSTNKARSFTVGTSALFFDAFYKKSGSTGTGQTELQKLLPKTGAFVALYMYPSGTGAQWWQQVYDQKVLHPSVPFVAAFNPNSGVGSAKDSNIANWVTKLRSVGVIMIGYTYTNYGGRALSAVNGEADKYVSWYGADGLFLDEMTNKVGFETYYSQITAHAKSVGMKMTMANPGTDVPQSFIGTVTVINITEGSGYMPMSWLQYCVLCTTSGWHQNYDKRNFVYIRYGVSWLDTTFLATSTNYVGLAYITNGTDADGRWFHLPPYFAQEVATLDR